jgi:hypothetical protein
VAGYELEDLWYVVMPCEEGYVGGGLRRREVMVNFMFTLPLGVGRRADSLYLY